jgi:two-component sensor histidine kinase
MGPAADPRTARTSVTQPPDLGLLFHRLNNQLGIILANAELLEAKATDEMTRARASQVVASVLDAMATAREVRIRSKGTESSKF